MATAASIVRPVCPLAAVNGSIHALALTIEGMLRAIGESQEARDFTCEVSEYLDAEDVDVHYRTVLAIARRYVELV